MEPRTWPRQAKHLLKTPGVIETAFALILAIADLWYLGDQRSLPLLAIFGGVQTVLVAITALTPTLAAVVVPIYFLAFTFLPDEQAPMQIFCALLIVELMRTVGHLRLAQLTAVLLWALSNYDATMHTFTRDIVATVVTTLLFLIAYGIGAMRHNNARQRQRALDESHAALHQQRLKLATFLHDSTAKSFTRVTMQSQALAIQHEDDNPQLSQALDDIAETSREGLLQLRQLLALLKSTDDANGLELSLSAALGRSEPIPTLNKVLDQAKEELEEAGFTVRLINNCDAVPSLTHISEVIAPTISEACTNIQKYGEPNSTILIVASNDDPQRYSIAISNQIATTLPFHLPRAVLSSGFGLSSLRRRAKLLDGSVDTTNHDGTWTISINLPLGKGKRALDGAPR